MQNLHIKYENTCKNAQMIYSNFGLGQGDLIVGHNIGHWNKSLVLFVLPLNDKSIYLYFISLIIKEMSYVNNTCI
jgi:hypothetical protein